MIDKRSEPRYICADLVKIRIQEAYVDHVARAGVDLFNAVCARDLEGIVAKLANAPYTPEATTWVKFNNAAYSQAEGRADFFEGRGAASAPDGGIRSPARISPARNRDF
jgi:hypothetical protein